jgi:hypothetical protein
VLTSTLTAELEAVLAGQGAIGDSDTGLVHLGQGRFYDPTLGRPLQPNFGGAPPTIPQALNPYAATSLGQPGVAEAVVNGSGCLDNTLCNELVTGISGLSAGEATNTPLFNWAHLNLHRLRNGRILSAGPPPPIRRSPKIDFEIFSPEPGVLRTRTVVNGFSSIIQSRQVLRSTPSPYSKIISEAGEGVFKNALPFGVDFAFQLYQDWDNPRLPWDRKINRAFTTGGVGIAGGIIVYGVLNVVGAPVTIPTTLIGGIIIGLTFESWTLNIVFNNDILPVEVQEVPRNLQPLE